MYFVCICTLYMHVYVYYIHTHISTSFCNSTNVSWAIGFKHSQNLRWSQTLQALWRFFLLVTFAHCLCVGTNKIPFHFLSLAEAVKPGLSGLVDPFIYLFIHLYRILLLPPSTSQVAQNLLENRIKGEEKNKWETEAFFYFRNLQPAFPFKLRGCFVALSRIQTTNWDCYILWGAEQNIGEVKDLKYILTIFLC